MWPEVKRSVYFDTKELGNSCVVFPYCVFFDELFGDSSSGQILIFFSPKYKPSNSIFLEDFECCHIREGIKVPHI